MQQDNEKVLHFNKILGELIKEKRMKEAKISLNKFAREYDFDRGNLSKIENGILNCRLVTAWKISEALGIKFSEFAKILEDNLEENFTLIDN
ncbi:MAG: helix-turn-helix transcriptional regulator [bacterium]|nr:helix-turn-helix transcriptional regulator [bacterium]